MPSLVKELCLYFPLDFGLAYRMVRAFLFSYGPISIFNAPKNCQQNDDTHKHTECYDFSGKSMITSNVFLSNACISSLLYDALKMVFSFFLDVKNEFLASNKTLRPIYHSIGVAFPQRTFNKIDDMNLEEKKLHFLYLLNKILLMDRSILLQNRLYLQLWGSKNPLLFFPH